ncbi:ABC transporter permease [Labrys okinawensis]|uniref:ABC transporter permease n=1 Tax=Labrys okinawensis TaxID=346911 RepID=UPI0039BCF43D
MVDATMGAAPNSAGRSDLSKELRRAERRQGRKAFYLVLPCLLFILLSFIFPIARMLFYAGHDSVLATNLPQTELALQNWNGEGLPDEGAYAALAVDLKQAGKEKTAAAIGKRVNYELPGTQSRVAATARRLGQVTTGPYKNALVAMDPMWGERDIWAVLKRGGSTFTSYYLLRTADLRLNADSSVEQVPPDIAIFRDVFARTFAISISVTALALLLGFPLAYFLAMLPPRKSNLLMIMVLLPFWTSLLVRTTAWVVLLQPSGPINSLLMALHIVSAPVDLIFNRFSTVVAMTYIQLPFTLLPIYSVMRGIPPTYVRAARSLGAGPFYAFWKVYFPQTLPGIGAGCLLSFILCLGFYITPALVGGPRDQMISYFIAFYTNQELNWGMASALGSVLLIITLFFYYIYVKIVGVDRVRLG